MKIVVSHIIGGLGNQMFQYATGLAAAQQNNAALRIDCHDFSWYRRSFVLDSFRITAPYAAWWDHIQMLFRKRLRLRRSFRHDPGIYRYDPTLLDMGSQHKIFLVGHWQNEKYFSGIRRRILEEFILKPEFSAMSSLLGRAISDSESVAVHIRRGDNVGKPDSKNPAKIAPQPGMVSEAYVATAMSHIREHHPDARFFIFSDEISWVKEHFSLPFPSEFITSSTDVQQFELMSRCKHQIIANSTYSWWAAWLNDNPAKIVCAPKRWDVRNPDYDTSGLLPAVWKQF